MTVPRVADVWFHRLFIHALDYDPFRHFDLTKLNLVFLAHESVLTAITSNRIAKFCASKKLIEEYRAPNPPPPQVPQGRIALDIVHMNPTRGITVSARVNVESKTTADASSQQDKKSHSKTSSPVQTAFHPESLSVIARFNERRCKGLPLYGADLIAALTVVDSIRPCRTRFRGEHKEIRDYVSDSSWSSRLHYGKRTRVHMK